MVKRQCLKCNATFERKSNYDKHINKKFDCRTINDKKHNKSDMCRIVQDCAELCRIVPNCAVMYKTDRKCSTETNNELNISNNELNMDNTQINMSNNQLKINNYEFYCYYCNKHFSFKSTLTRHLKDNCKIKKENDDAKENIFKLLLDKDKQHKEEVDELKKQNKLLMDKIDKLINMKSKDKQQKIINNGNGLISNSNNSITTNQNSQNNFITVNFGKEDLSIIDEKIFMDRIIKKPLLSGVKIPDEVLKIIHFNPQYPQLSNIYISDINREKCMVFEDNEWKLSNIDNIPQIIDKVCIFSSEQINTLKNKHPNNKSLQDRLNIVEKYNNMIDNDFIEDLKDDTDNDNKKLIQRCEEFQKHTYNTFKKTLYNEGKKIKKNYKK